MDVKDKHITLVGLGRTSLALADLLLVKGAHPLITESKTRQACGTLADQADTLGIELEFGGHTDNAFVNADIIVPSPGVSPEAPPIAQAAQSGIPVLGELEIASRFSTSKIIAVTGTNGKTTTTSLLHAMVTACGHQAALAGNNDTPFSRVVQQKSQPEYVVLEVSSYQLETISTFKPWIAVVLNLTNDHLGRHKTMENYAAVKARLMGQQSQGDTAIINEDDPWVRKMYIPADVRRLGFSLNHSADIEVKTNSIWLDGKEAASLADIPLKGKHNLQNVIAALGTMHAGGFDSEGILAGLRTFQGVEHRIEFVQTINGVDYYNDSKATNLDSLKVALESFDDKVVLIAGGQGKGGDYSELYDVVAQRVGALILIGEDAQKMETAWGGQVPTMMSETMHQAVIDASHMAVKYNLKTVLLSPACASFDQYDNFEQRGIDFKTGVAALQAKSNTLNPTS